MSVEDIVELALRSTDFEQFKQRLWDYRREMSDDRRKSLIVGNLPEETVAALKDARMPNDAMSDEPNIVINGQTLTAAQAMAVRVAITSFHAEMAEADALGGDEHGRRMATTYRDRLSEVLGLMQ